MLVFVEATGNGILGHVPRTRRAWPLSSKPDGILDLGRPDEVLQNTPAFALLIHHFTWLRAAILTHIHARMHF
jgi:hypothetical protein